MSVIDLSTLPPPTIVHPLDWEADISAFIADLKARLPEWAGVFESDTFLKVAESWAYRLTLERQSHNEDARSILLAYATGQDLDHIAATYYAFAGVTRSPSESDASFRERIQLAPEAYSSAGSAHAYRFHARTLDPVAIPFADVVFTEPGRVRLAIQTIFDDPAEQAAQVASVVKLFKSSRLRTSDILEVLHVAEIAAPVAVTLEIEDGPDPALVQAAVETALADLAIKVHRPRGLLTRSAIAAASHRTGVRRVTIEAPTEDVEAAFGETLVMSATVAIGGGDG